MRHESANDAEFGVRAAAHVLMACTCMSTTYCSEEPSQSASNLGRANIEPPINTHICGELGQYNVRHKQPRSVCVCVGISFV